MVLHDFLSRQKHDDSNPYKIIPIPFTKQGILQTIYYNLRKGISVKYLLQTQSQVMASGIKVPEVHGVGKGLDLNIQLEMQGIKPMVDIKRKEISEIKLRLGQGRVGLRSKLKIQILNIKSIVKMMENPSKVLAAKSL